MVAPLDKSLTIIGDTGILTVCNVRQDAGPVWLRRYTETGWRARLIGLANRAQRRLDARCPALPWRGKEWVWSRRLPLVRQPAGRFVSAGKPVDFARGPAELADAIREQRACRLSADLACHLVELVEVLQHPERRGPDLKTDFPPMPPMAWVN